MSDLAQLEQEILGDIAAAGDEAALEAVRIAALGKSGSVSALLKTLGSMTPDERKARKARAINGLKDKVTAALAARKDTLKNAALNARLNTETVDVTLPMREAPAETGRMHPISQVIDELTAIFADMGFAVAEGPDIETDDLQFHQAELSRRPSGAGDARHLLFQPEAGRLAAACCARIPRRCRSAPC